MHATLAVLFSNHAQHFGREGLERAHRLHINIDRTSELEREDGKQRAEVDKYEPASLAQNPKATNEANQDEKDSRTVECVYHVGVLTSVF